MPQIDIHGLLKNKGSRIAVIGATNDRQKYGHKIFHDLLSKGYKVYPINPRAKAIDGHRAYKNLHELVEEVGGVDLLNFVLHPKLGIEVAKEAIDLGLDNFWLQPGAESPEIIDLLEQHNKHYLAHACVMVESAKV